MYLSIIVLPLLGSIVSGFFGRKIGVTGSRILSCLSIITTTILAIISFFEVGLNNNPVSINLFKWLDSESFNIVWNFQFDSLTVSMLIPVLIISSLVHFYSIGYMSHDPHNQRFFSYLSLFTFMMIILVTGNNYLLMFVGWEGVGVCSYLLVSFWFTRIAANQSSMSAFLTNRVGDCFLTIGMFVILWSLGNLDYSLVFSLSPYINENIITIIGICLLIGAMAKSSQVGLHIWLPMAMEGPTPVSALIHAATMVTAGVYLLIRSSPLIEYSSTVLLICLWLGAVTTVFSSLIGLFQQDIKKIIAYSTMSQLGMMVIAIGLSSYNIAIFHLINHAFYKGLLFLGAGAVIHAVVDNQDLRKYGGLISFLPLTYTVILIASLSLVALPFMTGYYSKDFILESAYGQYNFSSINVYVIAVIGAIFTTLYSVKVLYLTFLAKPNGSIHYYKNAHESDIFISLPLVILAIFSIYFGFITKDIFIGLGSGFFTDNSIFIHPLHEILINTEFAVPTLFKLIPFIFTLFFTTLAIVYSEFKSSSVFYFKISSIGYYIFGFFNQRFLIEFFYNKFIVNSILNLGGQTTKVLDKGSIEWVGPYGIHFVLLKVSKIISNLSKGVVTNYALYILVGICFYLSIFTLVSIFFDLVNSITASSIIALVAISYYINTNTYFNENENNLNASSLFYIKDLKLILLYSVKVLRLLLKPRRLAKLFLFCWANIRNFITNPYFYGKILISLILVYLGSDPTSFDDSDGEEDDINKSKDKEKQVNRTSSNPSETEENPSETEKNPDEKVKPEKPFESAFLSKMKNVYLELMKDDDSKWQLDDEDNPEPYYKTSAEKQDAQRELREAMIDFRIQDSKDLANLTEKLTLNEEGNSSENKRVIDEEASDSKKVKLEGESSKDRDNEDSNKPKEESNPKKSKEDSNPGKGPGKK